jgi:uncharacterized membrane protein YfcA
MKLRHFDLEDASPLTAHTQAGLPPLEHEITHLNKSSLLKGVAFVIALSLSLLVVYLLYRIFYQAQNVSGWQLISQTLHDPMFWSAVLVGLIAQTVDGALGMAYGITCSSFLMATGAPPALASGATHLAEVFTTGASGISHIKLGNVNKKLFLSLLIPGVLGVLLGTYVLTSIEGKVLKPYITVYLLLMGIYILTKAFRTFRPKTVIETKKIAPLALLGGFVDVTGGGGWGPVVTTSLVGAGHNPRSTIGSVNLAEFFLTIVTAAAFFTLLDETVWVLVAGIVVGGLLAAPFAAYATKYFSTKTLLVLVGLLISCVSLFNFSNIFA